jgi:hypothetical protein
MNINQQQTNLQNLMAAMGLAYRPQAIGGTSSGTGTSTTQNNPSLLSTLSSII